MLGITMEESGVSKIIALRLDQDIKLGAEIDHSTTDFEDEDVEVEEGIVIPPRPPKRNHTEESVQNKKEEKEDNN